MIVEAPGAHGDVHFISMQDSVLASSTAEQPGLLSHTAARQEHQEHPGTKGQLAVDIRQENMFHDRIYSSGGAPSDFAQDTTVATAPPAAAALPDMPPGMAGDSAGPARPDMDASSPSAGNDSTPADAAPLTAASVAPAVNHNTYKNQQMQNTQQEHQRDQQLLLQQLQQEQQQQQDAGALEHAPAASAAVGEPQQPQQHQQQQGPRHYSLGLELLGEAAGLLPSEGHMAAAAAAAAAVSATRPSMTLTVPVRQARMSHNQLTDNELYSPPPHLPMPTGITIPKPEGVQCQVPGCHSNLNAAGVSTYFKRHRVCLTHAKADQVPINGMAMRFCQQCGIMHPLADFDGSRKSCRVQLDRHNLRRRCRRKTQITKGQQQRKPESSSRGGGGSSVSPSGMAISSPPRTNGGKRAAARAAAAAFAAAAASESAVTDETSRDREVEGGYTYGDADWMGDMYGATDGAGAVGYDAAAAAMPVGGGYYQMPGPARRGTEGTWPEMLATGGYSGMGGHSAAQVKTEHMLGTGSSAYGLADLQSFAAGAPYMDQQGLSGYGQMGYAQQDTQQQAAAMQGWDSSSVPGAAGGQWGSMAAGGASVETDMAAAVGAAGNASGSQLTLQQLRLHIASVIASGKGPGITAIRNLGFVQQLLVVDELANSLIAEIKKAGEASSTAADNSAAAFAAGSSLGSQQHQQISMNAAGAVQSSRAAANDLCGPTLGGVGLGGGIADAAAAAAAGGAGPQQLMQLLSQLARNAPGALGGQGQQQGASAGSLSSPRGGAGGAAQQLKREPVHYMQQAPAPKRQRSESGAGERDGGAAAEAIAAGIDSTWLRHLLRYASHGGATAADIAASSAAAVPQQPQQATCMAAIAQAAEAILDEGMADAAPDNTRTLGASDNGNGAVAMDAAPEKSAMVSAAVSLLQAAGVKMDGGNQQALALLTGGLNASSNRGPAVSPVLQGSRTIAAAGNSRAAAAAGAANMAGSGNSARPARESSSQFDAKAMQAALLRSLASGLQGAGEGAAHPAGPASGGQVPFGGGAGAGAEGKAGSSGPNSNSTAQQLLSTLLHSLAAAKR